MSSMSVSSDVRLKPFINGGLASLTAEIGTFPIDTAKTRLQVQGQVSDATCSEIRYRGMVHALYRVFREEGFRALYHGLPAGLLRQASYGTMKIGLYHYFKTRLALYANGTETLYMNIISGISAGAIAAAIANPTDVLKVRMQAATSIEYQRRQNVFLAFIKLYQSEGVKGLYRGVGPTSQRAAVVAGVLLPSYDFFKKILIQSGFEGNDVMTHFVASFLAGILGAIATNPIDVVKSRMMNQNTSKVKLHHFYQSSFDCCVQTIKTEGFMALYKGFTPSYLRLGPWNIIFFMTYEQLQRLSFT
ncbi:PREDICTED: kidney mitochondrial carrier protein 1-like [Amphimedon queenslandica]|uniref:Uncharacterized protein n=1 Tax=Amphimedon queenslandica TaxID=400682 RepID=A0A1X7U5G9_AMPQE|nr:PREDICTED: kidney mitochondrial carrier protein 1-like [Amphimedon queenslandica]|eukprot:XP_011406045.2 PREDICTED: kidney mitochondrial carrier protein 1-like [Amphimedon queenslandica]